jgi:2-oxoglutarate ferredoxin oxidoreductase subunit beta
MTTMSAEAAAKVSRKDFVSDQDVRWCPGCGDYSILANVQRVMPDLGVPRENVVFVSGIGCSSRFPYYMNTYGFHTIHGRAPAFATGMKVSNPDLSIWIVTGDGDGLSIGGNHLLHTVRRNVDTQILLFNNRIYGLTKGQYSPTSSIGTKTKSTPQGAIDHPIDPITFALGCGATFVARTIDVDAKHMPSVLRRAHEHKGTAFVEILQNCPVFNDAIWEEVQDRKTRATASMVLEHGEPLVFGQPGSRQGITLQDGLPAVIDLADEDDPVERGVVLHDERRESPSYASILASLQRPEFPLPVGVFRAVEKTTYEDALQAQIDSATEQRGAGDLGALLHSGDTWEIA